MLLFVLFHWVFTYYIIPRHIGHIHVAHLHLSLHICISDYTCTHMHVKSQLRHIHIIWYMNNYSQSALAKVPLDQKLGLIRSFNFEVPCNPIHLDPQLIFWSGCIPNEPVIVIHLLRVRFGRHLRHGQSARDMQDALFSPQKESHNCPWPIAKKQLQHLVVSSLRK